MTITITIERDGAAREISDQELREIEQSAKQGIYEVCTCAGDFQMRRITVGFREPVKRGEGVMRQVASFSKAVLVEFILERCAPSAYLVPDLEAIERRMRFEELYARSKALMVRSEELSKKPTTGLEGAAALQLRARLMHEADYIDSEFTKLQNWPEKKA